MTSYVGSATGTNSVTMPTHQAGDLLIAFASTEGVQTPPTMPAGWTSIATNAVNTFGAVVARQVATSSSMASGTWTGATGLLIMVYRPTAGYKLVVGGSSILSNDGTLLSYPATTMQNLGPSWVVRMATHKATDTAVETPPTGYTNRTSAIVSAQEIAGHDSNGVVTTAPLSNFITLGGTDLYYIVTSVEVMELPLILFRSLSTVAYGASHTSTVLTAPAGLANDDILIAEIFTGRNDSTGGLVTPTAPAGFTLIDSTAVSDASGDTFRGGFFVYWKRAASESGSYTFTHATANTNGVLRAYSGCITSGSPVDVYSKASINDPGGTQTTIAPSVTTTVANDLLVWSSHDWNATGTLSPPTGFTERYDGLIYSADKMQATAGASGSISQTNGNGGIGAPWSVILVALKAAVSGGSTTNKTVTISSATTVSALKQARKIASIAPSSVVSALKQARRTLAIAPASAVAAIKQARKTTAIAATATVTAAKQARKIASIAATSAVVARKQVAKRLAVASSPTVAAIKSVGKKLAVAAGLTTDVSTDITTTTPGTYNPKATGPVWLIEQNLESASHVSGTTSTLATAHAATDRVIAVIVQAFNGSSAPITITSATLGGITANVFTVPGTSGYLYDGITVISATVPTGTNVNLVLAGTGLASHKIIQAHEMLGVEDVVEHYNYVPEDSAAQPYTYTDESSVSIGFIRADDFDFVSDVLTSGGSPDRYDYYHYDGAGNSYIIQSQHAEGSYYYLDLAYNWSGVGDTGFAVSFAPLTLPASDITLVEHGFVAGANPIVFDNPLQANDLVLIHAYATGDISTRHVAAPSREDGIEFDGNTSTPTFGTTDGKFYANGGETSLAAWINTAGLIYQVYRTSRPHVRVGVDGSDSSGNVDGTPVTAATWKSLSYPTNRNAHRAGIILTDAALADLTTSPYDFWTDVTETGTASGVKYALYHGTPNVGVPDDFPTFDQALGATAGNYANAYYQFFYEYADDDDYFYVAKGLHYPNPRGSKVNGITVTYSNNTPANEALDVDERNVEVGPEFEGRIVAIIIRAVTSTVTGASGFTYRTTNLASNVPFIATAIDASTGIYILTAPIDTNDVLPLDTPNSDGSLTISCADDPGDVHVWGVTSTHVLKGVALVPTQVGLIHPPLGIDGTSLTFDIPASGVAIGTLIFNAETFGEPPLVNLKTKTSVGDFDFLFRREPIWADYTAIEPDEYFQIAANALVYKKATSTDLTDQELVDPDYPGIYIGVVFAPALKKPTDGFSSSAVTLEGWYRSVDPDGFVTPGSDFYNGTAITNWTDRSGHGRTLVKEGTLTYNATGLGTGIPTVDSAAAGAFRTAAGMVYPAGVPVNAFAVLRLASGANLRIVSAITPGGHDAFGTTSGCGPIWNFGTDTFEYFYDFNRAPIAYTPDTPALFEGYATDSTHARSAYNGTPGSTASAGINTPYIDRLGFGTAAFSEGYATARYAELVVVFGIMTADDIAFVEGYIAWNNGLEGSLPSGHTYKSAPPMLLDAGGGSTTFDQAVSIAAALTIALSKRAGKTITLTANPTVTNVKQPSRLLAIAASSVVSAVKRVNRALAITALGTVVTAASRAFLKTLAITATSTVTVGKQVGTKLTVATTATITTLKAIAKSVSLTSALTQTAAAIRVFLKTVAISATATLSLSKQARPTLAIAATSVITTSKQIGTKVYATATAAVTSAKQAAKQVSVSATVTETANAIRVFLKTVSIACSPSVTLIKQSRNTVTIAAASAVIALKQARTTANINIGVSVANLKLIAKLVAMTLTGTVVASGIKVKQVVVNLTVGTTVALKKALSKPIAVLAGIGVTATKAMAKTLNVTTTIYFWISAQFGEFVGPLVKVWTGTEWRIYPLKVWNGIAWIVRKLTVY